MTTIYTAGLQTVSLTPIERTEVKKDGSTPAFIQRFILLDNHVFNSTDEDVILSPKLLRYSQSYTSNAGRTGLSRLLEV